MRFNKLVLTILFGLLFAFPLSAQWDPQISQYWKTKTHFNPSFAGENDTLQATVLHRQQWLGIKHAPKTFVVSADMPLHFLGHKHGVGISGITESIGLFRNTIVGGQYVYKKSWKRKTLNVGIQLSYASIKFDASGIHDSSTKDGLEEGIQGIDLKSAKVDGNIGVSWVTPKYYVGLSMTHFLKPSFDTDENTIVYMARNYYLTAGYNYKIRYTLFELQPSVLIKTDTKFVQCDVTGRVVYNKMFNGGMSWRKGDGFVFLLGLSILGFDAGYAYDLSTSEISKASNGTHELYLRYIIPMLKKKKGKFKHKSIRIL